MAEEDGGDSPIPIKSEESVPLTSRCAAVGAKTNAAVACTSHEQGRGKVRRNGKEHRSTVTHCLGYSVLSGVPKMKTTENDCALRMITAVSMTVWTRIRAGSE